MNKRRGRQAEQAHVNEIIGGRHDVVAGLVHEPCAHQGGGAAEQRQGGVVANTRLNDLTIR
jgi:hypothetical protein